ncbi:uncharacterized protein LOC129586878 [Paramacrobiotus metropolitanus]|uniref:uncharacterized protein LOC129586878 n=1 Tax=Paramacrobiotus metropolitanus TaxID=2943436 RepID=UPI002445828E|nr:uncharacterized protein LOC129586878 [Paramacrobiotus metropolitanus]
MDENQGQPIDNNFKRSITTFEEPTADSENIQSVQDHHQDARNTEEIPSFLEVSTTVPPANTADSVIPVEHDKRRAKVSGEKVSQQKVKDIEQEVSRPTKTDQSTQTVFKTPKVYLTQAWKDLRLQTENAKCPVDFKFYQLLSGMESGNYDHYLPDSVQELASDDSFVRIIQEKENENCHTTANNYPSYLRHQMYLGNYEHACRSQTVDLLQQTTQQDPLWFCTHPKLIEKEILANKKFVKEYVKTTGVFAARDAFHMLHLKKARRKLPPPLFAIKNKPHKDDTLQYKVGSVRHFEHKAGGKEAEGHHKLSLRHEDSKYIYDLPPHSVMVTTPPVWNDDKDFSIENLSELNKEIFNYAKKQKDVLFADTVVFYTVKKIDGPLVTLEQYPPRRPSPSYVRAIPDSLQYGLEPLHAMRTEHSTLDMSDRNSHGLLSAANALHTVPSSNLPASKSHLNFSMLRRGTLTKDPNMFELVLDYRVESDILCRTLIDQTWRRVVNLQSYLALGCRFLPNISENAHSAMLIPVGIHDGRIIGILGFIRNSNKPVFSENECEAIFTYVSFLTRYRYFTGVRNEERKVQEKMRREMQSILQLKEASTEEFLHHTLMLVKILTDADRSSSFLVNTLTESLRAERHLVPFHLGTGLIDPISGRPSYRRGYDIRMSVDRGIVGCTFRHRRTYASVATQDNKHFFSEIDRILSNKTESQVCVPFVINNEPYGMVEVLNKRSSSSFSDQDIDMLHLNSVFPAVGILLAWYRFHANKHEHLINLQRSKLAYARKRQYHRTERAWMPVDVIKPPPPFAEITRDMLEPTFFFIDHLSDSVSLSMTFIFDMLTESSVKVKMVFDFIETIRNAHFRTRFKDWKNAFATLQSVYAIVQQTGDLFSDDEKLTMLVAALCHGVDHFWYNATLTEGCDPARGLMYVFGTTTPNNNSVYYPSVVLWNPSTNIFSNYKDKRWRKLLENSRSCVSATQLPGLLLRSAALRSSIKFGLPNFKNPDFRQHLKEFIVAAASLHFVCRSFELYQEIVQCALEEYYSITGEFQDNGAEFCQRWDLPDDPLELHRLEVEFLRDFCLPVFDTLRQVLPETNRFYECCGLNLERLSGTIILDRSQGAVAIRKMHRRNVTEEMKERMRQDLYPLPVEASANLEWVPLEDMQYITRNPHHRVA